MLTVMILATVGGVPAMAQPPGGPGSQVSAGTFHTCARDDAGRAYCWGDGAAGQVGAGDDHTGLYLSPSAVLPGARPAGVTFTQVAAGGYHTCGLGSDG